MSENLDTRRKRLLELISREGKYSLLGLMARSDLAETYLEEGLTANALLMQEETLAMLRDSKHIDLRLATLNSLSLLYDAGGKYSLAEKALKEELELRAEKAGANGRVTLDTLATMCHLARVYKNLKKFEDAARLLKEVISIQSEICYVGHLDMRISIDLYESLPGEFRN